MGPTLNIVSFLAFTGALGDGTPAFNDHKGEDGLTAQFIVDTRKVASVDSETECAARCALRYNTGTNDKCSSYKYDAETKDCFFIDWAAVDLDNSDDTDLMYSPTSKCVVTTKLVKNKGNLIHSVFFAKALLAGPHFSLLFPFVGFWTF